MKVLLADKPGKADEILALAKKYPGRFEIITGQGIGADSAQLKEVIKREQPDIVFIRSTTKAFKDPEFLQLLNQDGRVNPPVILRGGADTDNVNADAAREAGVVVVRTHGNQNSVANLFLRFLFAYLRKLFPATFDQEAGFSETVAWKTVVDLPPAEFKKAIGKSLKLGRGSIGQPQTEFLFAPLHVVSNQDLGGEFENIKIGLVGFGVIPTLISQRLERLGGILETKVQVMATSDTEIGRAHV